MTWTPTQWAPRVKDMSRYVTLEKAQEKHRCVCQGCVCYRGQAGYPCGSAAEDGVDRCRWCW